MSSSGSKTVLGGTARRDCRGLALAASSASAQTYGFATLPPGTLNHTTASAISKV